MKFFEVTNEYAQYLGEYLVNVYRGLFQFVGRLMFKHLLKTYGPEFVLIKWKQFCDSFRFSRHTYDKSIVNVVRDLTKLAIGNETINSLANDLNDFLATFNK